MKNPLSILRRFLKGNQMKSLHVDREEAPYKLFAELPEELNVSITSPILYFRIKYSSNYYCFKNIDLLILINI